MIGGANEFQEYALGYYGVKSSLCTSDISKVCVGVNILIRKNLFIVVKSFANSYIQCVKYDILYEMCNLMGLKYLMFITT